MAEKIKNQTISTGIGLIKKKMKLSISTITSGCDRSDRQPSTFFSSKTSFSTYDLSSL